MSGTDTLCAGTVDHHGLRRQGHRTDRPVLRAHTVCTQPVPQSAPASAHSTPVELFQLLHTGPRSAHSPLPLCTRECTLTAAGVQVRVCAGLQRPALQRRRWHPWTR
eukprot:3524701-Rhodomonas_salina.1